MDKNPVRRKIFFASSLEGLTKLREIAAMIVTDYPDIQPIIWRDAFPVGQVPFEALENVANEVVGALILATPDDSSIIRRKKVMVPRANVMLELGYFAALLGLTRTAVCKYSEAVLPTDLGAVTHVPMGDYFRKYRSRRRKNTSPTPQSATKAIKNWAADLPAIAEGCSLTKVIDGYSGRWMMTLKYRRWRGTECTDGNSVIGTFCLDLTVFRASRTGFGCVHGTLVVKVGGCEARFRVVDLVSEVVVKPNGSITFMSETLARHRECLSGTIPQDERGKRHEGFDQELRGTKTFLWELAPRQGHKGQMLGTYQTADGVLLSYVTDIVLTKAQTP
jgi:hypothetical protein